MITKSIKIIIIILVLNSFFSFNYSFASPGVLDIVNRIDAPYTNFVMRIVHMPGASEGYGSYDHNMGTYPPLMNPSGVVDPIYSLFEDYRLDVDARPVDSTSTINLGLFIMFEGGSYGSIDSNNYIQLSMPLGDYQGLNYQFLDEDIFININGQTYDVKKLISDGGGTGIITLPRIETYTSWDPYTTATVTFKPYPIVETVSTYDITEHSATLIGQIIEDSNESCEYRFSYYKEGGEVISTEWQSGLHIGDQFTDTITGLDPNTLYYYITEIKNSIRTTEGETKSFYTEKTNPTVETLPADNISLTTAKLKGILNNDGDPEIELPCHYRFSYWKEGGSVITTDWQCCVNEGDSFSTTISGLESGGILYYYFAEASNSDGYSKGSTKSFKTGIIPPSVETHSANQISQKTATLRGKILSDGDKSGNEQCSYRFFYWLTGKTAISTEWKQTSEGLIFSDFISGLDPNSTYSFYAQAKNSSGTTEGTTLSFKTLLITSPVSFNPNIPSILIENYISQFEDSKDIHKNQGNFTYTENKGNLETIDSNDVPFTGSLALGSQIYSKVMEFNPDPQDPNTTIIDTYDLSKQANPQNPKKDILISMTVTGDPNTAIDSANFLRLWANDPNSEDPNTITTSFAGPLTLQQFDPNMLDFEGNDPNKIDLYDPNLTSLTNSKYPVMDLKKYINQKQDIKLENLTTSAGIDPSTAKKITMGEPYTHFALSRTKEIADVDNNGVVDMNDIYTVQDNLGKTLSRADVADGNGTLGVPDGMVDPEDARAIAAEIYRKDPNQPMNASPFGVIENFEGYTDAPGTFKPYWINGADGTKPWTIDTKYSTSGGFSARSGVIGDSATSGLEFNVKLEKPGVLSFKKRSVSESGFDFANIYINGTRMKRWSGNKNWSDESFNLTPGVYNIRFTLEKGPVDGVIGEGFWLDDVQVIPNEYLGVKAVNNSDSQ